MVDKRKAVVHMGPKALDYGTILPVVLTDEQVLNIVVPPQSEFVVNLKERGRVVLPKSALDALGISVGEDVRITLRPVKATDGVLDE